MIVMDNIIELNNLAEAHIKNNPIIILEKIIEYSIFQELNSLNDYDFLIKIYEDYSVNQTQSSLYEILSNYNGESNLYHKEIIKDDLKNGYLHAIVAHCETHKIKRIFLLKRLDNISLNCLS